MYSDIHSPDNQARLYSDKHGNLWVTHEELLANGYTNLHNFDIVFLNGKFYELQHLIRSAMGWWVEEVYGPEAEETSEEAHGSAEDVETPL